MNKKNRSPISRVNNYNSILTDEQIKNKHHRDKIGGLWDSVGQLQLDFLIEQGLQPNHNLLDIGCGCLRGGIKFIDYLDSGKYYGTDINESLIRAGNIEIQEAFLTHKNANLMISDGFEFSSFNTNFDYMIGFSLFTHLHINLILKCLKNVHATLNKNGKFFATFFISENDIQDEPISGPPEKIKTNFIMDPFHYSFKEINMMAKHTKLKANIINEFSHPRHQSMVCFYKH